MHNYEAIRHTTRLSMADVNNALTLPKAPACIYLPIDLPGIMYIRVLVSFFHTCVRTSTMFSLELTINT